MTVCVNDALICFGTFLLSQLDIIKIRLVLSAKPALLPQNNHGKITEKTTGKAAYYVAHIMGAHNSHYIFFSLVVKSGHKMLSLSLSLCVGRLHEEKWLPSSGSWAKSCWENDFGPVYGHLLCVQGSFHRSLGANTGDRPISNTAIRRTHQRHGAQFAENVVSLFEIHSPHNAATYWAPKLQIQSTIFRNHISFLSLAEFHGLDWH